MAEPIKSTIPAVTTIPVKPLQPTPQPAFVFNRTACLAKVKEIRDHLQTFVGRPGFNAFDWMAKKLTPLEYELNEGAESKELQDKILALKKEQPVAKGAEHNVLNPPKEAQAAGRPADEATSNKVAEIVTNTVSPKIGG